MKTFLRPTLVVFLVVVLLGFSSFGWGQTQTFTSTGTFTAPAGVTSVTVECWGGGGAGGGATGNPAGGGGGAGGAYAKKVVSVVPGTSYTVTVGATAVGNSTSVVNGNPSWFGTAATVYAQGGAGGGRATSNSTSAAGGTGSSASSIGDVVHKGGNGGTGASGATAGGGGEGSGASADGNNGGVTTGGSGLDDGGDGGNGGLTSSTGGNGNPGSVPGGGGGGGRAGSYSDRSGGNGAAGRVIVSYTSIRYSVANGNWNSTSTWSATSGGPSGASVPVDGANVFIEGGRTVTMTAAAACRDLNIASGSTLTTGNYGLALSGDFVNAGTFNAGSSNITITGGTDQSIAGFTTTGTVTCTKTGGRATLQGNVNGGALDIQGPNNSQRFNLGTGLTHTFTGNLTRTGYCIVEGGSSRLKIGGSNSSSTIQGYFYRDESTVEYYGAAQTIAPLDYWNLTLSGSGLKSLLQAPVSLPPDPTGLWTGVEGVLSMEGTATLNYAPIYLDNATLQYNTATSRTAGPEWITPFVSQPWWGGAGGNVVIANTGTITLNEAKVLASGVPLTINSGATLDVSASNYALDLKGNFTNSGTFIKRSGTVTFSGGDASLTAGGSTFYNVILNKGASNALTLVDDLSISNIVTLTAGYISTGSNMVDITNTSVGAVVATNGIVNGKIRRALVAANASGTYLFNDASTSFTANGANGTSATFQSFPNTFPTYGNSPSTYAVKRYYSITAGGTGSRTLSLSYRNAAGGLDVIETNGLTEAALTLWSGDGAAWLNQGGARATVSNPLNSAKVSGSVSTFSDWTFAQGDAPLPVQLATFNAVAVGQSKVVLSWSTVSETNNYGFEVEKSASANDNYQTIANSFVAGHGTTLKPEQYSYVDETAQPGVWYYRLKQIDLDGTVHYSDGVQASIVMEVKETAPVEFALNQNYPNPFNPETEIKFSVEQTGNATLRVYNSVGQEVATLFNDVAQAGQYYRVRLSGSGLASGVYFYRLQSEKKSDLKKMLLLK